MVIHKILTSRLVPKIVEMGLKLGTKLFSVINIFPLQVEELNIQSPGLQCECDCSDENQH